ncbi:uncharacterized protein MAM_05416 [Metarhizium album ARSEF 1941]|uniref:Uncharacterized protein n=1 Tax=Metarhizium album (strain ARSEF 1941) TaxID=1081103 RepID=A0A0B2WVD6_METAS|nr:uncharacterized protein MAM_05416 [Metarhizium album ARSEF 1941]KHN96860.1 hypothetical protein MAM_05416 [Metarhizium album ARSEF 1941]
MADCDGRLQISICGPSLNFDVSMLDLTEKHESPQWSNTGVLNGLHRRRSCQLAKVDPSMCLSTSPLHQTDEELEVGGNAQITTPKKVHLGSVETSRQGLARFHGSSQASTSSTGTGRHRKLVI